MKFYCVGLLFCVATAIANQRVLGEFEEQKEEYLIDIENFNFEDDTLEYISPQIDDENGNCHDCIFI